MKNHEWVNGKLLQTNKKYSQLKLKQKEKIHEWMYAAFRDSFRRTGKFPGKKEDDEILAVVMQKIEEAKQAKVEMRGAVYEGVIVEVNGKRWISNERTVGVSLKDDENGVKVDRI